MSGAEWVAWHGGLDAGWDALADRVDADPWLRPGWFRAWEQAFARQPIQCLVLRDRDELRAIVPLLRRGAHTLSPTNWHSPGFGVLAADDAARRALLDVLAQRTSGRLALAFLDAGDAAALLRCAGERRVATRVVARSPYVTIGVDAPSRNMRRNLRKARRRLERRGAVTFDVVAAPADVAGALEEGLAIEAAGWKGRAGTAIRSQAHTRRFYGQLARWAAARGTLRLCFLRVDGRAAAFEFLLHESARMYNLKGGFDEAFADASPGSLLLEQVLRHAAEQAVSTYEFLGDRDAWKLHWTSTTRPRHEVQVFGDGPAATARWLAEAYARPLARNVRAHRNARSAGG